MSVLLTRVERSEEVVFSGVAVDRIRVRRNANGLVSSTGEQGERIVVRPRERFLGIEFDERVYDGELIVLPHPQRGLRVINQVPLEDYVAGVVAAEISIWSAQPAQLEAQAIAARTYALKTLERRADEREPYLLDSIIDQAYHGRVDRHISELVTERMHAAVRATAGQVLMGERGLWDARFHAACGGRTAWATDVFADAEAAPSTEVDCGPCKRRAERELRQAEPDPERPLSWRFTATRAELGRFAQASGVGERLLALEPAEVDTAGRWITVRATGNAGTATVRMDELRRTLGYERAKSSFIVGTWPRSGDPIRDGLLLRGIGRGHGVGLCQEGSREYAELGWSSARILSHYYSHARVQTLTESLGVQP